MAEKKDEKEEEKKIKIVDLAEDVTLRALYLKSTRIST